MKGKRNVIMNSATRNKKKKCFNSIKSNKYHFRFSLHELTTILQTH